MAVMGESIQQCRSHLLVNKHRGPFGEAEIGGNDDAGSLVQLADQMEQQGATDLADGQVAQFVEDHQVCMHETIGDSALLALAFFLLQLIHEFDGGEEPHALVVMLNGLDANGCRQVRLARARAAHQDHVLTVFQELAAVQRLHQGLIHQALAKVEAG